MQLTRDLEGMFTYSTIPIILCVLIIIGICVYFYLTKPVLVKKIEIKTPDKKDREKIRQYYLSVIDKLLNDFNNGTITNRIAYQSLSTIIRKFVFEMTNIKVQYCDLTEIKELNMPILYELVSDYYDPEFAKTSKGNITDSINKTREAVSKWN